MAASSRKCLLSEQSAVIMEEKPICLTSVDKTCLVTLLDIFDKGGNSNDSYDKNVTKIVAIVESLMDSAPVFRSFCAASFLDRYSHHMIIASVFEQVDGRITKPNHTMHFQLRSSCQDLLGRMVTIENLSSADSEMVCLLCQLCRRKPDTACNNQLLQIGRMAWPYTNRSLWGSDHFVSFICDIWEAVGSKLEEICSKNFVSAWKSACSIIIGKDVDISGYSRLRLLAIFECRNGTWALQCGVTDFYRNEYINQFLEIQKKAIFSAFGSQISKRKTSLTTKRGMSAADFIKRRKSQNVECQEKGDTTRLSRSISNRSSSSECSSEVFEDISDTDCDRKESSDDSSLARVDDVRRSLDFKGDEYPAKDTGVLNEEKPSDSTPPRNIESTDEVCTIKNNIEEAVSNGPVADAVDIIVKEESPRRSFVDKKTESLKVERKFVGRIIGSRGSAIILIQEQSGARIRLVKQNGTNNSGFKNNDRSLSRSWREEEKGKARMRDEGDVSTRLPTQVDGANPKESDVFTNQKVPSSQVEEKRAVQHYGRTMSSGSREESFSPRLKSEEDKKGNRIDKNNNEIRDKDGSLIPWSFGRRWSSGSLDGKTPSTESSRRVSLCTNGDTSGKSRTTGFFGGRRLSSSSFEGNRLTSDNMVRSESSSEDLRDRKDRSKPGLLGRRWSIGSLEGKKTFERWCKDGNNNNEIRNENGIIKPCIFGRQSSVGSLGGNTASRESLQKTVEDWDEPKRDDILIRQSDSWRRGSSGDVSGVVREKNVLNSCMNESVKENGSWVNRRYLLEHDKVKASQDIKCDSGGGKEHVIVGERKQDRDDDISSSKSVGTDVEKVDSDKVTEKNKTSNDEIMETFEIVGTAEEINDAKQRIQKIVQQVKLESRTRITRSFSEIAPSRNNQGGFGQFKRSLSCPVQDWDDSCHGTCDSCIKGRYCRAFLVGRSQSPRAWVRPQELSLNRTEDWVGFIVETKANFLRRDSVLSESTTEQPSQ